MGRRYIVIICYQGFVYNYFRVLYKVILEELKPHVETSAKVEIVCSIRIEQYNYETIKHWDNEYHK